MSRSLPTNPSTLSSSKSSDLAQILKKLESSIFSRAIGSVLNVACIAFIEQGGMICLSIAFLDGSIKRTIITDLAIGSLLRIEGMISNYRLNDIPQDKVTEKNSMPQCQLCRSTQPDLILGCGHYFCSNCYNLSKKNDIQSCCLVCSKKNILQHAFKLICFNKSGPKLKQKQCKGFKVI